MSSFRKLSTILKESFNNKEKDTKNEKGSLSIQVNGMLHRLEEEYGRSVTLEECTRALFDDDIVNYNQRIEHQANIVLILYKRFLQKGQTDQALLSLQKAYDIYHELRLKIPLCKTEEDKSICETAEKKIIALIDLIVKNESYLLTKHSSITHINSTSVFLRKLISSLPPSEENIKKYPEYGDVLNRLQRSVKFKNLTPREQDKKSVEKPNPSARGPQ